MLTTIVKIDKPENLCVFPGSLIFRVEMIDFPNFCLLFRLCNESVRTFTDRLEIEDTPAYMDE